MGTPNYCPQPGADDRVWLVKLRTSKQKSTLLMSLTESFALRSTDSLW
jgi:hypothetical protein